DFHHKLLDDSKKTTEKSRLVLREIIEKEAVSWNVQFISPEKIDEINILNASIFGMQQAALQLQPKPEFVIIDGNRFHAFEIPHKCFIKGDGKFKSIAAASILAKTHRDEFMEKIHAEFPEYNWNKNKGYPTLDHRKTIIELGLTPYHRKTFHLKNVEQLQLNFD
ncbi:MAG: ribonuclease HII, partial [Flavobacteriia bacterium]